MYNHVLADLQQVPLQSKRRFQAVVKLQQVDDRVLLDQIAPHNFEHSFSSQASAAVNGLQHQFGSSHNISRAVECIDMKRCQWRC